MKKGARKKNLKILRKRLEKNCFSNYSSPDSPNADRNKKNRTRSMSDTSEKIKELRKSVIQNEAAANGKSPNK